MFECHVTGENMQLLGLTISNLENTLKFPGKLNKIILSSLQVPGSNFLSCKLDQLLHNSENFKPKLLFLPCVMCILM